MAEITASLVKELRDKTGAGMMDCKAALNETKGDIEAAVDWLRKKGLAKAAKKAGRVAAEGLVGVASRRGRRESQKDKGRRFDDRGSDRECDRHHRREHDLPPCGGAVGRRRRHRRLYAQLGFGRSRQDRRSGRARIEGKSGGACDFRPDGCD